MNPTFYFIDMELCDFNLDVYIRRNFPQHLRGRVRQFLEVDKLTVEEKRGQILGVLRDIIAGVQYIHSAGEIHRILRPGVVMSEPSTGRRYRVSSRVLNRIYSIPALHPVTKKSQWTECSS